MLSPSLFARRRPPEPPGRGSTRGWHQRHPVIHLLRNAAVAATLALWAGWALADPENEAGSAAELEAQRQPFVMEWGSPLNTNAAAPAALIEQVEATAHRLDDWRQGEHLLAARQAGGSLLMSRIRLDAETGRDTAGNEAVFSLGATQRASVDMNNVAYRWWFAREGRSLAVGVGAATYRVRPANDHLLQGLGSITLSSPLVSVGVRQRVSESALLYLDAASARRLDADAAGGDYYGARAGVQWQTSRNSTFAVEQGRIRMRLYSGPNSQMSLRIKRGGPMLVYRRSF